MLRRRLGRESQAPDQGTHFRIFRAPARRVLESADSLGLPEELPTGSVGNHAIATSLSARGSPVRQSAGRWRATAHPHTYGDLSSSPSPFAKALSPLYQLHFLPVRDRDHGSLTPRSLSEPENERLLERPQLCVEVGPVPTPTLMANFICLFRMGLRGSRSDRASPGGASGPSPCRRRGSQSLWRQTNDARRQPPRCRHQPCPAVTVEVR